jgi:pyruvate,water dikinase
MCSGFLSKDVIVRMSDFKSNEYANLIGGKYFEPDEENPMIGFRGASRYYSDFIEKGLH